jgi:hypothetical protein
VVNSKSLPARRPNTTRTRLQILSRNPQQKIKHLDDFVKQYPNSTLMPYVYKDYYLTDFALKNFAGTMEYVDRMIAPRRRGGHPEPR